MDDEKVLIIMTSGPDTPRRCATPFFMAHLAAVMESEVTMFFTIDGIKLVEKGVAENIYPKEGGKPVSEFRDDCLDAGVRFVACTAATELHDLTADDLIDGVEMAGGAAMLAVAGDAATVLSF
jgi:predicted peroxiredoxin